MNKIDLCKPLEEVITCKMLQTYKALPRVINCLTFAKIRNFYEVCLSERNDLMRYRNFGNKSITDLDLFLKDHGLRLGMTHEELDEYQQTEMPRVIPQYEIPVSPDEQQNKAYIIGMVLAALMKYFDIFQSSEKDMDLLLEKAKELAEKAMKKIR